MTNSNQDTHTPRTTLRSLGVNARPNLAAPTPAFTAGVLEVDVHGLSDEDIRRTLATMDEVRPGRYVRLYVGATLAPLWVVDFIRTDLVWQPVAASERALASWETIGGNR
jgi:hypothetical protein